MTLPASLQVVVAFASQIHVFEMQGEHPSVVDLKKMIIGALPLHSMTFALISEGDVLSNDDVLSRKNGEVVEVTLKLCDCVCGGKGGFGALLRSMSKKKGARTTKDFGACRDLNGRRIRHVNDELVLQKWKEARDRNEEFDPEQRTQSGIDLWFLSTPSWAEGFGKKKKGRNLRRKSRMCMDWLRARENGSAPADAPSWWGCPRGRRCEFAHGEEELQGPGAINVKAKKALEESEQRSSYVGSADIATQNEEIEDLVSAGLKAQKRMKLNDTSQSAASDFDTDEPSNTELGVIDVVDIPDWITVLSGSCSCDSGFIRGQSEFSTVVICPEHVLAVGSYYYEIRLLTDGIIQVITSFVWALPCLTLSYRLVGRRLLSYHQTAQLMMASATTAILGLSTAIACRNGI
jgi:hypothetical protein